MIIARTHRFALRPFRLTDATGMACTFEDPEVMRFGSGVQDFAWIERWIQGCLEDYRERGFGLWAVEEKQCGAVIGCCGLTAWPDIDGRAEVEIGYRLARSAWGRGYATEAARAVRDHAFCALRLDRLIALIDPANVASIRVAEKIGFRYEKQAMLPGYDHPDHVYAMAAGNRDPRVLT